MTSRPRDIEAAFPAIPSLPRSYVTDWGNDRVQIFDVDSGMLMQMGDSRRDRRRRCEADEGSMCRECIATGTQSGVILLPV